jgi:predicted Abi (CAAX) family protease
MSLRFSVPFCCVLLGMSGLIRFVILYHILLSFLMNDRGPVVFQKKLLTLPCVFACCCSRFPFYEYTLSIFIVIIDFFIYV